MTAPQPKTTTYLARGGDAITVSGFAFTGDPRGGSLSAHGKATGEAFWPVGAVLADYLCWARRSSAEHLIATKAPRCTATAWMSHCR